MTELASHCCPAPRRAGLRDILNLASLAFALRRHRQRLRDLPPHILNDIGVSPADAAREANRALWDVPANWRR